MTAPSPPSWPHCGADADSHDPVGCRGRTVPPHNACLAHLSESDRNAYLTGLSPGADLDHRGTPFTSDLLAQLLQPLRDPSTDRPRLGTANFSGASFTGAIDFAAATFTGTAGFGAATFANPAYFERVTFTDDALFTEATFAERVEFRNVTFAGNAWFAEARLSSADFSHATFAIRAHFPAATFYGFTLFAAATFTHQADFWRVTFCDSAQFRDAVFETAAVLGPLACRETLDLSRAWFHRAVTIEAAAAQVSCRRTVWRSTATLRLRYATVDLTDAVVEYPLLITAHRSGFGTMRETVLADRPVHVAVYSIKGCPVTAGHG